MGQTARKHDSNRVQTTPSCDCRGDPISQFTLTVCDDNAQEGSDNFWSDDLLPINSPYRNNSNILEPAALYLQGMATVGRGWVQDVLWNTPANEIIVLTEEGAWVYDAQNIQGQ